MARRAILSGFRIRMNRAIEWWHGSTLLLPVAGLVLGLLVGGVMTSLTVPTYMSVSYVYMSPRVAGSLAQLNDGSLFVKDHMKSYSEIAASPAVLERVASRLGRESAGGLSGEVSAALSENSMVLRLSARQSSPAAAVSVGEAFAEEVARTINLLEVSAAGASVSARVISPAESSATQTSPNRKLNMGIAGLVGGGLGFLLANLRMRMTPRQRRGTNEDGGGTNNVEIAGEGSA